MLADEPRSYSVNFQLIGRKLATAKIASATPNEIDIIASSLNPRYSATRLAASPAMRDSDNSLFSGVIPMLVAFKPQAEQVAGKVQGLLEATRCAAARAPLAPEGP